MSESYRGFTLNETGDATWGPAENAFHKAIIDKVLDETTPIPEITRITSADSPYTMLTTYVNLLINTDGGVVVSNLPAGTANKHYIVINSGTSGNDITLNPNGAEDLIGENSAFTIRDGEVLDIWYNTTDGWY
jgi:hypothetical protein